MIKFTRSLLLIIILFCAAPMEVLPQQDAPSDQSSIPENTPTSPTQRSGMTIPVILDDLADRFMTYPNKEMVVVWIIDDSGSLVDDREAIKNKISDLLDAGMLKDKKVLNMAVIGFGDKAKMHCGISRDDNKIKKAIMDVGIEGSGIENCMAAIDYSIEIFKKSTFKKIFIIVTDEMSNDESKVEETLELLKKNKITVYVIGGEASFQEKYGEERYRVNPNKRELTIIDSGKESLYTEILDGWFGGTSLYVATTERYKIKSGFGPYALSRLCVQTEGKYYFLKGPSYPAKVMKSYEPDLCSDKEYQGLDKNDNLRTVVSDILKGVNWDRNDNNENRNWWFEMRHYFYTPAGMKASIARAKEAMSKFNGFVKNLESVLVKNTPGAANANKRWLANGELALAQLYRGQYRLNQYVLALEEVIKKTDAFQPPLARETATHHAEQYVTEQSTIIRNGNFDGSKTNYKALAESSFQKVIEHHPDTTWSIVAQKLKEEYMDSLEISRKIYQKGKSGSPSKPR